MNKYILSEVIDYYLWFLKKNVLNIVFNDNYQPEADSIQMPSLEYNFKSREKCKIDAINCMDRVNL